ncbi:unknown [Bacteroides eggerthii CAG:109]|nr:unknown [Bacteroides eggerthii CAG:109]
MRTDNQHGSGGFKTHTTFNADNRVAYVHIASDAVGRTDFLYFLNSLDGIVECFVVDGLKFTFLKGEAQLFAALFGAMFQVGAFRKSLCGIQNLAAANGGAPQTYIIGIFQFGEVGCETMFVQVVYLFLTAQCHVACQGDDFHTRSHDEESHVETYLVVACTG